MEWHEVTAIGMQMDLLKQLALGMCASLLAGGVYAKQNIITVLAPNNYFPPPLIEKFETEFSASVNVINYNDVRIRDDLFESYSTKIDVALTDKQGFIYYVGKGAAADLSETCVEKQQVDENLLALTPGQSRFARLISYTTFGVLYNNNKAGLPETWADILNPDSDYISKTSLPGTYNNAMAVAFLSLPKHKTQGWHTRVSSAGMKLKKALEANPDLFRFTAQDVLTENILIAPMKVKDAVPLMKLNPNLSFGYPEELTRISHEYAFIHSETQNQHGAERFLNFITRKESLEAIELQSGVFSADKPLINIQHSNLSDFFITDPANVQFELLKANVIERLAND